MSATLEQTLSLGPDANGIAMSPEEFDAVDEWDPGYRYELIRGVIVVSPIPLEGEADPNDELGHLLRDYRDNHRSGSLIDKTLPERYVYLEDGSRRRADRVVWIGLGRRPQPKTDVPAIVIEFVSKARRDYMRDYVEKRREYLALGVKEYWVIDRFRRQMTVYKPDQDQLVPETRTYTTDLLPGFELPLSRLLNVADAWGEPD